MTETVKYRDLFPRKEYKFFEYTKEDLEAAVLAEREACAKVCDEWNWSSKHGSNPNGQLAVLAAAIRARGA